MLDSLELDLRTVSSWSVCAGNQTWVLCKNKCSQLLGHPSLCQQFKSTTCHATFVSRSGSVSPLCPQNPPSAPPPDPSPCRVYQDPAVVICFLPGAQASLPVCSSPTFPGLQNCPPTCWSPSHFCPQSTCNCKFYLFKKASVCSNRLGHFLLYIP